MTVIREIDIKMLVCSRVHWQAKPSLGTCMGFVWYCLCCNNLMLILTLPTHVFAAFNFNRGR